MGERKVLNKYIPPDFDPSLLPKFKRNREKLIEVRMMLPFSLRCNTCGEYMYRGKKFNSKTERIEGEDYMGIRKIRFYIKCSVCSAEITFKTDPKNADYECESGASRNYEIWRDNKNEKDELDRKRQEEEEVDAMKALENRTMDNKVEMDILDALDEIKAMNQRHLRVDTSKILDTIAAKNNNKGSSSAAAPADSTADTDLAKEDEELIKSIQFGKRKEYSLEESVASADKTVFVEQIHKQVNQTKALAAPAALPAVVVVKKKRKIGEENNSSITEKQLDKKPASVESATNAATKSETGLMGLLGDYGDDDE